ncbi:MAG: hypothetical protein FWC41_13160 [Firmicutes bacterium]|nr:hypothetical protein [Bacillota bacterium]
MVKIISSVGCITGLKDEWLVSNNFFYRFSYSGHEYQKFVGNMIFEHKDPKFRAEDCTNLFEAMNNCHFHGIPKISSIKEFENYVEELVQNNVYNSY